jgi:hypothetical protein
MVIVVASVVMKDGIECGEGRRDNNNDGGVVVVAGGGCTCVGVVWRAADVYWHFDGCPSHLRRKKEIVYEGLTRMRRATPPGMVGVAGSHCV